MWLQYILFGLAIVLVILLIISFFLPSKVRVVRSKIVQTSIEQAFDEINALRNWEKWSLWSKLDPDFQPEYFGASEGKGAGYKWISKKRGVGKGQLIIVESEPPSLIRTELDFYNKGKGYEQWSFEPVEGGTKITWAFKTTLGFSPMKKYFGLMFDRMMGPSFEQGLTHIQEILEGNTEV